MNREENKGFGWVTPSDASKSDTVAGCSCPCSTKASVPVWYVVWPVNLWLSKDLTGSVVSWALGAAKWFAARDLLPAGHSTWEGVTKGSDQQKVLLCVCISLSLNTKTFVIYFFYFFLGMQKLNTHESHQTSSRSEQSGGVRIFRRGCWKCGLLFVFSFHFVTLRPFKGHYCVWYTRGHKSKCSTPTRLNADTCY